MTPDIERQFFNTFGIEPRKVKICRNVNHCPQKYKLCNDDCKHWQVVRTDYPQITDKQYLQLVCWVNERRIFQNFDVNGLKEYVLKELCTMVVTEKFKQQVQALFKEG